MDEQLYSRQLYVLGRDAMKKLVESTVIIIGMSNLGVETAKNIILGGVKSVTLYDQRNVILTDMSFYHTAEDVGKNRAVTCAARLASLNPHVNVNVFTGVLTEETLLYDLVIVVDATMYDQIRLNNLCTKFISCSTLGLTGQVFCDFGNFTVYDSDGETVKTGLIDVLTQQADIQTVKSVEPHGLYMNDYVTYPPDVTPYQITTIDKHTFSTSVITTAPTRWIQHKLPVTYTHDTLLDTVDKPQFCSETGNSMQLHMLYQMFDEFSHQNEKLVTPDDINEFMQLNGTSITVDPELAKKFVNTCLRNIAPVQSVIGGIVAQEAFKALTGKYTPINQWYYYDCLDIGEFNCQDATLFVVGAGAIGCEIIKNLCMLKVGNVIITDMDTIERSNLNRQFLFRDQDIGTNKAVAINRAAAQLWPHTKITAHTNRVGRETEHIYTPEFYASLTGVINALDNIPARLYTDSQCILHSKPLFESGTLGVKGSVQAIIPHLTEHYGATTDPTEHAIPACTLKYFPYNINHTIQSARDLFEGLFVCAPQETRSYLINPDRIHMLSVSEALTPAQNIKFILDNVPTTYTDCVQFAMNYWYETFNFQIKQLLQKFPLNHTTDNVPFWSGEKRAPTPIEFDMNNTLHTDYINSFAQLWGELFGIKPVATDLSTIKIPVFKPVLLTLNDKGELTSAPDFRSELVPKPIQITPVVFDRDNDLHMSFVTAASNLRACNYSITPVDMFETRRIAGAITPAIATTTAVVAGLAVIELLKYLSGSTAFKNTYLNLGLGLILSSDPAPPVKNQYGKTIWDVIDMYAPMTVKQLLEEFEKRGIDLDFVMYGSYPIWNIMQEANLNRDLSEVLLKHNPPKLIKLTVGVINEEDEELPAVRFWL